MYRGFAFLNLSTIIVHAHNSSTDGIDNPGPRRVLLEVLQPLSHGCIREKLPV